MSTLTQLPLTTNAPAIEPSNQPIPSHATYMSKAVGGELGAIAESGISAGATAATVTSNAAEEEKTGSTNATGTGVRILKKTMSTDSMLDDKSSTAGGQSSSGGGTPSSAKQRKYERKTKRFIWPDELHRLFVAAIFDVGLKNASPKALLGLMSAAGPDSGLTTEHLKSHLQKYRLNYERSRAEFLEFYDHSAKKNLKRRRKNGNKPGEHNTMFVFPISHKKRKGGEDGGGDSDDSNSDNDSDDDAVEEMSDSTLEHTTPRGSGAGNSLLGRTGSFTSMMQQDPKDPMAVAAVAAAAAYAQRSQQQQQQLQIQNSMLSNSAMNDPRASFSNNSSSQAQAMAAAYAANQRKASLTGGNNNSNSNNNRAMAAAAAAAAAFRYPMGLPMGAGAGGPGNASGGGGQLGELSDPQWNILSSLMSPHITGMNGAGGGNVIPTSEGMNGGGDQFQLHDEPNDLQLQMHLAMQAQMNLHRQMLTRKVEVSQHLINSQHDGNNGNNGGNNNNNNYGLGWGTNAQQQQQHHHHQQQQQRQQQQQYFQQDQQQQRAAAAAAAARQVLANSSHHPQMQMNLAANAAGMGNNNNSNQTPRPSLAPRTSNNNNNSLAATTSAMVSSSLGMGNTYAAASGQRGGIPTSVGPVDVVNVLLNDNSGPDGTLGANLGFDKNSGGGNNGPPGATASAAAPVDDDSLDLYRWDRIDLNVELDDDDLFGFLKS